MKRKIGQITLYNYNYGSTLQCYATQQIVSELGYQCVLFCIKENRGIRAKGIYLIRALVKMATYPQYGKEFLRMMQAQRKRALSSLSEQDFQGMETFINEEIHRIWLSYPEMKKRARSEEYKAFLSGSDQIWNGSWFLRNHTFFLRFAPKKKRIAWAPSFGTDKVAVYNKKRFQEDLKAYRCLSVREESGKAIIRQLTGRASIQLVDPVLQISADKWRKSYIGKSGCMIPRNYVFCYFLNEPGEAALKYLNQCCEDGMKVLAFASGYECLKKLPRVVFEGGSPWNYLQLMDQAEKVCSDSFHALAFSLIFHKDMQIFQRKYSHGSDQSERIISLLGKLNLSERFVGGRNGVVETEKCIDFGKVDKMLEEERLKAVAYLQAALEE